VPGEAGKTVYYYAYQVLLYTQDTVLSATIRISVAPVADLNLPLVSNSPGSISFVNVTTTAQTTLVAQFVAANVFPDLFAFRIYPDISTYTRMYAKFSLADITQSDVPLFVHCTALQTFKIPFSTINLPVLDRSSS
jgi:hypothetical protein